MPIEKLELERFRCLPKAKLEFDPCYNLLVGPNGAGKTSVLEAIYYLASGRSFRGTPDELLMQTGESQFVLCGQIRDALGIPALFGVAGTKGNREVRLDGKSIRSVSEFARRFPVQVIDPEIHRLLEDGPAKRRRFIDWGVFHVEHAFHDAWRRFSRALLQRNAAFKVKSSLSDIWESDIAAFGSLITGFRESYLNDLRPFVASVGLQLLGQNVEFEFQRGWKQGVSLADALKENRHKDELRCLTSAGPHRAELVLKVDGATSKDRVSRGQQKLLACVLLLGQQLHRIAIGAPMSCLLLDDPAAELDADNLGRLIDVIADLPVQLVVTALSSEGLDFLKTAKLFHVERGHVQAMA